MSLELGFPRAFARIAVVAWVSISASACSSMPNWVDPTNWMGGGDQTVSENSDQNAAATPDLAGIPDKPAPPSTVDERTQVADSLKADRADAQYSGDALRGGTEPSAAPPPPSAPAAETAITSSAATSAVSNASVPPPAAAQAPAAGTEAPSPAPEQAVADAHAPTATAPVPPAPAQQVAATQPGTQGVPSAVSPATSSASDSPQPPVPPAASADQLGFLPSTAPALDPSVAHFVPPAILEQYRQTSAAPSAASEQPKSDPTPSPGKTSSLDTDLHPRQATDSASGMASPAYAGLVRSAAFTNAPRSGPAAVVLFPRDAAVLGSKAKAQILAAARSFKEGSSDGFVRVIGHSSSRTGNMPMARHLAVVFEHSQDFATAVADELIRDGVPADKVLIEAVGDSQPVYYESMPQGEAGNRRAEIFL